MKHTNKFNRTNFLNLSRQLRSEGSVTIKRGKIGACDSLMVKLDGTTDYVAIYQGVTKHTRVICGFVRKSTK